jgi:hypothetical protein
VRGGGRPLAARGLLLHAGLVDGTERGRGGVTK